MEYSELEKLWIQYDSKLNHLESLNKKLILETLSKKPQKKINWLQFRNYYGLIIAPAILIVALHPQFKSDSLNDTKFVIGAALLLTIIGYITWHFITLIKKIKKIDLINDTVVQSANNLNKYKLLVISRFKSTFITFPVTMVGVLLIGWEGFNFDRNLYLFIVGIFLFAVLWGKNQLRVFNKKLDKLVNDINELKEYKE